MKRVRITVVRKVCHRDLIARYENPIEHACDLQEGQVFIAEGWQRPEGLCESAWQTLSPFVMTLAHGRYGPLRRVDEKPRLGDALLQRRLPSGELSGRGTRRVTNTTKQRDTTCDPPF